jgi:hypothetical protein
MTRRPDYLELKFVTSVFFLLFFTVSINGPTHPDVRERASPPQVHV